MYTGDFCRFSRLCVLVYGVALNLISLYAEAISEQHGADMFKR